MGSSEALREVPAQPRPAKGFAEAPQTQPPVAGETWGAHSTMPWAWFKPPPSRAL